MYTPRILTFKVLTRALLTERRGLNQEETSSDSPELQPTHLLFTFCSSPPLILCNSFHDHTILPPIALCAPAEILIWHFLWHIKKVWKWKGRGTTTQPSCLRQASSVLREEPEKRSHTEMCVQGRPKHSEERLPLPRLSMPFYKMSLTSNRELH